MKIDIAIDNLAIFFKDEDKNYANIPAEVFRDENGKITEIRIYNMEYEQMIIIDRNGRTEAISVDEYEKKIKFK